MTEIASLFAKVGILIDSKELKKVDNLLGAVEKSLGKNVKQTEKQAAAKEDVTKATEKSTKAVEKETKAVEKKVKAVDNEAKANKALAAEKAKQDAEITKRLKQQQALMKKIDTEAIARAKVFEQLQQKLAKSSYVGRALSGKQVASNRASFFASARASDIRTGQGAQYRLGAQAARAAASVSRPTIVLPPTRTGKLSSVNMSDRLAHLDQNLGTPSSVSQKMSDFYNKQSKDLSRAAQKLVISNKQFSDNLEKNINAGIKAAEALNTRVLSPVEKAAARLRLNSSQSSGGVSQGGNGYYRSRHNSPFYLHPDRMHLAGSGIGLGFAPSAAGLAAGGIGTGVLFAGAQVNQLRREQMSVEMQRTMLDVSSGYTTRPFQDQQNKNFFNLANETGVEAGSLINSYAQMMKSLIAQGQKAEDAFSLYKNMTLFAKGSGASDNQIDRASYAIGQVYGKGYLAREEWAQQLADALPGLRKFMMEVTGENLGVKTGEDFNKALENKAITPDMLVEAIRRAGQYAMPMVQTYASTAQADENRRLNAILEEKMARTLQDEMIPAAKNFTEAQKNLYEASLPLRDSLYSFSAALLNVTADVLNSVGKGIESVRSNNTPMELAMNGSDNMLMSRLRGPEAANADLSALYTNQAQKSALGRVGLGDKERTVEDMFYSKNRAQALAPSISGNTFNFEVKVDAAGGDAGQSIDSWFKNSFEKEVTSALSNYSKGGQ